MCVACENGRQGIDLNGLSDDGMNTLDPALAANHESVQILGMTGGTMTDQGCQSFQHIPSLDAPIISGTHLPDDGACTIVANLHHLPHLQKLLSSDRIMKLLMRERALFCLLSLSWNLFSQENLSENQIRALHGPCILYGAKFLASSSTSLHHLDPSWK